MKKGKTILSEHFREYTLSDNELKRLQGCLLEMFIDIKKLCDDNHILYMMSGGSCLGSVRHKGFIPWDDDIDIMMTREEYSKFRKCFIEKSYSDYMLAEPVVTKGYYYKMPKVYNVNTRLVSIREEGYRKYNMISIDVFIIENAPESNILRMFRSKLYNLSFHAASVCLDYMFPSAPIERKCMEDSDLKKYFDFRKRLGCIFSHIGGIEVYMKICEKLANYPWKTTLVCIPSAISYDREVLPSRVFENVSEGEFCGYKVNNPGDYDRYLSNLYKNYMVIPPIEKREIHVVYELKI